MYPLYLLFALDSPFSRPVLQTLLDAGHPPAALILPNPDRNAPLRPFPHTSNTAHIHNSQLTIHNSPFSSPSLTQTAAAHHIPLLTLGNLRHPDALAALRAYQPDLLLTACFPRLLPREILAIPRLGSLNLHPSLLPAYRGPEPLFWQFYFGETRTGVTLHWMDAHADTGDLVFQAEVPFPNGISLSQAETLTAEAGGALIRRALSAPEQLPRTPQPFDNEQKRLSAQDAPTVSYQPRPTSEALVIPTTWGAKRAFNFLYAARDWGPFEIIDSESGQRLRVREAVEFVQGSATAAPRAGEREAWVRFADGLVRVQLFA